MIPEETVAWPYDSLGRTSNECSQVPPPELPNPNSHVSSKSIQSSQSMNLSHYSDETSHFNVSLERDNTVAIRAPGACPSEEMPSQDVNTITSSSMPIQANHHVTPTLTDPIILVVDSSDTFLDTAIEPYKKNKPSCEHKVSNESEQEPSQCPIAMPEPKPSRPNSRDMDDLAPGILLEMTYMNEHSNQNLTSSNALTSSGLCSS